MKISELPNNGTVSLSVEVIDIEKPRAFTKFGKRGRVAYARVSDDSGEALFALWNEEIELLKPGQRIKLTNGYVKVWKGKLQLTTGRFGKIENI